VHHSIVGYGGYPIGDPFFAQTAQKNNVANPHSILHIRYKYSLPTGVLLTGNIRGQHFGQCPLTLGMRAISVGLARPARLSLRHIAAGFSYFFIERFSCYQYE
jgi:hypothetical protein